jgi:hypothetical protein
MPTHKDVTQSREAEPNSPIRNPIVHPSKNLIRIRSPKRRYPLVLSNDAHLIAAFTWHIWGRHTQFNAEISKASEIAPVFFTNHLPEPRPLLKKSANRQPPNLPVAVPHTRLYIELQMVLRRNAKPFFALGPCQLSL